MISGAKVMIFAHNGKICARKVSNEIATNYNIRRGDIEKIDIEKVYANPNQPGGNEPNQPANIYHAK